MSNFRLKIKDKTEIDTEKARSYFLKHSHRSCISDAGIFEIIEKDYCMFKNITVLSYVDQDLLVTNGKENKILTAKEVTLFYNFDKFVD